MSAAPESTLTDLQQTIGDLQRQLSERTAERDEAVAERAAMAEIVEIINRSHGYPEPVFEHPRKGPHPGRGGCGNVGAGARLGPRQARRAAATGGARKE